MVSFYCKNCKLDQNLEAEKVNNSLAEFFRARCGKCGNRLVRYISEKHLDPYYRESRKIKVERGRFANDLIQPGEAGFKMFYKKQYDELEEKKEKYEKEQRLKKIERENYYKRAIKDGASPQIVKKVLELEESKMYGGK